MTELELFYVSHDRSDQNPPIEEAHIQHRPISAPFLCLIRSAQYRQSLANSAEVSIPIRLDTPVTEKILRICGA